MEIAQAIQTHEKRPSDPPDSGVRRGKILAKTIFRELRSNGLEEREILAVATELLGQIASEMKTRE